MTYQPATEREAKIFAASMALARTDEERQEIIKAFTGSEDEEHSFRPMVNPELRFREVKPYLDKLRRGDRLAVHEIKRVAEYVKDFGGSHDA